MADVINKLSVVGFGCYIVGETRVSGVVVERISDKSCEWENGIDFMYCVMGGGQKLAEINNVPVVVEYEKQEAGTDAK